MLLEDLLEERRLDDAIERLAEMANQIYETYRAGKWNIPDVNVSDVLFAIMCLCDGVVCTKEDEEDYEDDDDWDELDWDDEDDDLTDDEDFEDDFEDDCDCDECDDEYCPYREDHGGTGGWAC